MRTYMLAPTLGAPRPAHAQTKAAKLARRAVAAYGKATRAVRAETIEGVLHASGLEVVADLADRVEIRELPDGPRRTAARLEAAGCRVAATRARDSAALSVWAVAPDGRRARFYYRRTAAGAYRTDGAMIDGQAFAVTAALVALEATP